MCLWKRPHQWCQVHRIFVFYLFYCNPKEKDHIRRKINGKKKNACQISIIIIIIIIKAIIKIKLPSHMEKCMLLEFAIPKSKFDFFFHFFLKNACNDSEKASHQLIFWPKNFPGIVYSKNVLARTTRLKKILKLVSAYISILISCPLLQI